MEADDDVPLILTWDEANSGLLNDEAERRDESTCKLSSFTTFCCMPVIVYAVECHFSLVLVYKTTPEVTGSCRYDLHAGYRLLPSLPPE